jgi:hypothetical protein
LQKATSAAGTHISQCRNTSHNYLAPGQWHTRLRYTIERVVPILVSPLVCHSLLTLLLEAKLTRMTISPTIVTMEPHELRFRLDFSSLGFSTDFSSLDFSLSFSKNTFPKLLLNLIGFLKSFVE